MLKNWKKWMLLGCLLAVGFTGPATVRAAEVTEAAEAEKETEPTAAAEPAETVVAEPVPRGRRRAHRPHRHAGGRAGAPLRAGLRSRLRSVAHEH